MPQQWLFQTLCHSIVCSWHGTCLPAYLDPYALAVCCELVLAAKDFLSQLVRHAKLPRVSPVTRMRDFRHAETFCQAYSTSFVTRLVDICALTAADHNTARQGACSTSKGVTSRAGCREAERERAVSRPNLANSACVRAFVSVRPWRTPRRRLSRYSTASSGLKAYGSKIVRRARCRYSQS
jgi:hypothetical protein